MMASFTHLRQVFAFLLFIVVFFTSFVHSLASSDTITWGGSNDRTGYETNHNMDPNVVGSPQFGLLWRTTLPGLFQGTTPEQVFAQPLVYTGSDGVQYVYVATTQNNIYKINAKTGTIVASRNLAKPFLTSDLDQCNDINPTIGITATGVIDSSTGTWYLTSKTYLDQSANGATGRPNGRYYFHAVSVVDLSENTNFPVDMENTTARNNPSRWFTGGIHHQRPGLLMYNNFVYAGFASHCIQYNYTGWIMGWDKNTGQIVEHYATEGLGIGPTTSGAGVWMSGGGIASDNAGSMYFASGNGYAYQLGSAPVSGRNPPTSLEEAVVNAAINSDGTISITDFFMPWEKTQLDNADKDLGTTPFQLLPSQFSCGSVKRIGMVTGKSGKTYWLNVDDLGGYKNGPSGLDNVLQTYQHENSVYSSAGVYPLEGGYVYINVIRYPTRVFQFSCQNGVPYFNPVATTNDTNSQMLGVGHGTTTSMNGQAGTGLFWMSDMEGGNLRVYNAVPNGGSMVKIASFNSPGTTKFTKLAFGNGVVFQGSTTGYIYAYGSPVNLPLNCTPISFGSVNVNATSSPQTVSCQAMTDLTVTAATLSGNKNFIMQNLPTFPLQVSSGTNFSFQAVFAPGSVGPLSSSIILNTTQAATTYTSNTAVQLSGTCQSQSPLLSVSPPVLSWNGVITGNSPVGVNQSVIFSNLGNSTLNITSIQYSTTGETGPWVQANGTSSSPQVSAYTIYGVPSSIPALTALTIPINFNPPTSGPYGLYLRITSNGGTVIFDAIASGYDQPKALVEFETQNGTWTSFSPNSSFTFGNVLEAQTRSLRLRLTNVGGANAAPLSLTVSKPPFGSSSNIIGANNAYDLAEGTSIPAGSNATAVLHCSPPQSQVNMNSYNQTTVWTMNLNDPNFGHQLIQFYCNAITEQYPPFKSDGSTIYKYAGCYKEFNPGRQLQVNIASNNNMTNEACIAQCSAAGYVFAATQYYQECWCGMNRPLTVTSDLNCYYECTGNPMEICGGNGIDRAGTYLSLFGDITRWDGNTTNTPGPYTNPGAFGFSSIGCWTDATSTRTLGVRNNNANSTVASCLNVCQGYQYAGVEYGGECYCDNSMANTTTQTAITDCSMTCNNNYTEYCGAGSRLNVYQINLPSNSSSSTTTTTLSKTTSFTTTTASNATSITSTTSYMNSTSTTSSTLSTGTSSSVTTTNSSSSTTTSSTMSTITSSSTTLSSTTSSMTTTSTTTTTTATAGSVTAALAVTSTTTSATTTTTTTTTASASTSSLPVYRYLGCYTDVIANRTLVGDYTANGTTMSSQYCKTYCAKNSYTYFAMEYGSECFCANQLGGNGTVRPDSECSFSCPGNSSETCGANCRLSVFVLSNNTSAITSTSTTTTSTSSTSSTISINSSSSSSSTLPLTSTTSLLSSVSSSTTTTPLSSTATTSSSTTSSSTTSSSTTSSSTTSSSTTSSSTTSSSTTSSSTTSSSSSITSTTTSKSTTSTSTTSTSTSAPTTTTTISSTTTSSTSSTTTSTSTTASTTSTTSSTTSTTTTTTTSSSTTTTTKPTTTTSTSTTLASSSSTTTTTTTISTTTTTSTTSTTSTPTTTTTTTTSTTTTTTKPTTTTTTTITTTMTTPPTTTTTTTTSTTTIPTTTTTTTPSTTMTTTTTITSSTTSAATTTTTLSTSTAIASSLGPVPPVFSYLSCASDSTSARGLGSASTSSSSMTPAMCQNFCFSHNMPYAGVEYSTECYCDYQLNSPSVLNQTGCTMACGGDSTQMCGGPNRMNVYVNTAYVATQAKPVLSGNFQYAGCFVDAGNNRTLGGYMFTDTANMTQELCVSTCKGRGYTAAGVEYGQECYCGNNSLAGYTKASSGDCNVPCVANPQEWCGGGYRLNAWQVSS